MVKKMKNLRLLGTGAIAAALSLAACATLAQSAQPVAPSPGLASPRIIEKANYGDWRVVCLDQPGGLCSAYQELLQPDTRQLIARVELTRVERDGLMATLLLPLGILLAEGVGIQVDGSGSTTHYAFAACQRRGCIAQLMVDADLRRALTQGKQLTLLVAAGNGERLGLTLSLQGLTTALAELPAR